MAPHSSTLAWKIPWTEEPGRLQSMGSLGVGYNWATSLSLFIFMHWRRKWQPTSVFLPEESQEQGSLVGFHLWHHTESDTTEVTYQQQKHTYFCFPGSSVVKNLPANAGGVGLIPGSGRSLGERNGNPLQCSCLGNSKDRRAWQIIVHGVAKVFDMTSGTNLYFYI